MGSPGWSFCSQTTGREKQFSLLLNRYPHLQTRRLCCATCKNNTTAHIPAFPKARVLVISFCHSASGNTGNTGNSDTRAYPVQQRQPQGVSLTRPKHSSREVLCFQVGLNSQNCPRDVISTPSPGQPYTAEVQYQERRRP